MRLIIVYQPVSEHARAVEEFVHEFTRRHPGVEPELLDADSAKASEFTALYDIVQYPTSLVLADDGSLQNMWSGPTMPLMNEVLGYLNV